MIEELITVLVRATVLGPKGLRLPVGQIVKLEDSPYVRILIKSGNVELIDPPSLDPEFLRANGLLPPEKKPEPKTSPVNVPVKELFSAVPLKKEKKVTEEPVPVEAPIIAKVGPRETVPKTPESEKE